MTNTTRIYVIRYIFKQFLKLHCLLYEPKTQQTFSELYSLLRIENVISLTEEKLAKQDQYY